MKPQFQIHLFGTPQFTYQGKPVTGFVSNKVRALLIYLAVTGRPHSRDALAALLWTDTPTTARINLRKALSNLRKLAGIALVTPSADMVALDRQQCQIDVTDFTEIATNNTREISQLQHAVNIYQADFLAGFNTSLSAEFEEWALQEQRHLQFKIIALLTRLSTAYEKAGNLDQAIATARRLLVTQPWHEETHRQLMHLLARTGNRSAALAQYQECITALKTELAADPAKETNALFEQIRAGIAPHSDPFIVKSSSATGLTAQAISSNVPIPATPLVGRQQVLAEITSLLQQERVRLLTLIGPGGVGKTRLAMHIGHLLAAQFTDGVYFVDLTPLRTTHLIPAAIADALAIRENAGNRPLLNHISNHLQDKQLLLIVDNFEHLIDGAPQISILLASAPQVKLLITSREILHIRGEVEFAIPPLYLPQRQQIDSQTALNEVESVQLFLQQARTVRPDCPTDVITLQQVADICIRLDGLPLAIELAAARTKMLDIVTMNARLDERFALLRRGPRDAPPRHQALQNTFDWSYDLLTVEEQKLLRWLAVFVGGCTLEAVEAIWSSVQPTGNALDLLTSLVDKSLLVRQPQAENTPRFTQLESILAYGWQKLDESGELDVARSTHAHYFLHLAEQAEPLLIGAEQATWLACLGADHDNLRAALKWFLAIGPSTLAARLGVALWHFWYLRSHHLEGTAWLEQILALELSITHRAKVLYGLGMLARRSADDETSIQRLAEALALFHQIQDDYYIASSLRVLGFNAFRKHDFDAAEQKLDEALQLFRELDDLEGTAVTLTNLGYLQLRKRDLSVARAFLEESLAIRRQTGNLNGIANCLDTLGIITIRQQDFELAEKLLIESWHIYDRLGNQQAVEVPLSLLGSIAYIVGEYTKSIDFYRQAYRRAKESGNKDKIAENQIGLALAVLQLDDGDAALAHICNAIHYFRQTNLTMQLTLSLAIFSLITLTAGHVIDGIRIAAKVLQIPETEHNHRLYPIVMKQLQSAVSAIHIDADSEAAIAWREGETMSLDEIVASVIATPTLR